ncbi:aminopeptidase-like protein [Annulohypoxylon maeteangense]|uniref:aminopeptidase-like protein n=1 Tax=Annulohypoxylon maeteangense TaxID=1927788 RepID=UPI0020073229|nr:aminopeptidase-like protein [Annulohypoxylon maeteangense]KAI0888326.1 aminopeptidase-like protein [Annulohypoxylon maeteangense]
MNLHRLPFWQLGRHLKLHPKPSSPQLARPFSTNPTSRFPKPLIKSKCTNLECNSRSKTARRAYSTTISAKDILFGQPVYETHPHLLKSGELTPGITAQEYHERRVKLMNSLPPNSAVILPSATLHYRSGAVFYPFRQESNFFYLTGFSEPDSLAVLTKTGESDDYFFHLYCRRKDPKAEQWNGPWSGIDAARDVWNADQSADIGRVESLLPDALKGMQQIYTDAELTSNGVFTKFGNLLSSAAPKVKTAPLKPYVNALRAVKSLAEANNMRRAGRDSGRALTEAMRRPWKYEKELAAFLEYQYQMSGLDGYAYIPVVAGGRKALLIHYVLNNGTLNDSEFVLVDAGGEYGTYITDITRTWPISGRFTPAQKDLYNAVLRAQRSSISLCRASANVTLDSLHRITENALCDQLQQLGFDVSGSRMGTLFPHHVGHYIGLDVHDVPGYPRNVVLKEGHCITIEPGIYVPDDERWPKAFRGLGIRIEDSVYVGDDSPWILTTEAVKEVDDIEALRN